MPVLVGMLFVLACSVSCSSNQVQNAPDPVPPGVIYEGLANHDALRQLLGKDALPWPWAGGAFDNPVDGTTLPAAAAVTFTWQSVPPDAGVDAGIDTAAQSAIPGSAGGVNGMAYFVVFSSTSSTLLRLFTDIPSYTPSAAAWQTLVSAQSSVSAYITTTTFKENSIVDDVYAGSPISFTIE
jgi:hypothetical protein